MKTKGKNKVEALKTISGKSNNSQSIRKEIYDRILEERMNEILKMSKKIDYYNLVYKFKGPNKAISFTKFEGPMYNYDQLTKDHKILHK